MVVALSRSQNQHTFAQAPSVGHRRSKFSRSHGHKTTFDAGWLIPFYRDEVLPGDTFSLQEHILARLATPLKPIMDNMYLDTHFFFVPMRLIWDNTQKFFGEQRNPGDSTDYLIPISTAPVGGYLEHSLQDYLGLPTKVAGYTHSALYTRAYNLIYNEWYRDENIQNSVTVDLGDGPDTPSNYVLLRRGKRKDYFTSVLPWPQKGPAVQLPLGSTAPILYKQSTTGLHQVFRRSSTNAPNDVVSVGTNTSGWLAGETDVVSNVDLNDTHYVDLSTATAATINQWRQALQMQAFFEQDARGGTRYTEIILSHFGVRSPDARLQRPEYIGGSTTPINCTPVPQTTPASGGSTPQGNLAGYGVSFLDGRGFTYSATEHGIILGICSVRADLTYQQGLHRDYSRRTRPEYFWPLFENIGEQAVLNKEIYTQGTSADSEVFGYQERYGEYKFKNSLVTGLFRSNATGSLDIWHLAQNFASLPTLNSTFIVENPPVDRCIAVPSEPHFIADIAIKLTCARPMGVFSVPGSLARF